MEGLERRGLHQEWWEPNSHPDAVLKSGIEKGVVASYDWFAEFLMSLPARGMEKGAGKSCAKQA
jgi:hypothetical protein